MTELGLWRLNKKGSAAPSGNECPQNSHARKVEVLVSAFVSAESGATAS